MLNCKSKAQKSYSPALNLQQKSRSSNFAVTEVYQDASEFLNNACYEIEVTQSTIFVTYANLVGLSLTTETSHSLYFRAIGNPLYSTKVLNITYLTFPLARPCLTSILHIAKKPKINLAAGGRSWKWFPLLIG